MVWKISPEELIVRYSDGERNFAGIELIDSDTPSRDYPGIDLFGVVLRDINLRGAYFNEVILIEADLTGADLGGIFLKSCSLSKATIRGANLCASNLEGSAFQEADLRGSNLNHMNASGASFLNAQMDSFEYAILAETTFLGAKISNRMICSSWNLIWRTTMPDETLVEGPQWGDGDGH
jgi:uncharacterized protein YjbI with pentapeptide repeats